MDIALLGRYLDYTQLRRSLSGAKSDAELFEKIVNTPFDGKVTAAFMGLGICVLLLKNNKTNQIDRIALSNTEQAAGSTKRSAKPFKAIKIPADYTDNILVQAINTGRPKQTDDWQYLFVPDLKPEEARMNQASAGVGCSVVYPLKARDGGALIFSYFLKPEEITARHHSFMKSYAQMVSRALRRSA